MEKTQIYKIDDFVMINSNDQGGQLIGKIIEFENINEARQVFFFKVYLSPDKTSFGKQSHHSKHELIKTDETQKEFVSSIIKKIDVFNSLDTWIKHMSSQQAHDTQQPGYFFRQKLVKTENIDCDEEKSQSYLMPQLKKICCCDEIFNPDFLLKSGISLGPQFERNYAKEILFCKDCGFMHHSSCMKQHLDQNCYSCKKSLYEDLYREMKEQRKRDKKLHEKQANNDQQIGSSLIQENSSQANETELKPQHEYPSLDSKETSKLLYEHIQQQKIKLDHTLNEFSQKQLDAKQRTRRNVKDNLSQAIQLGIQEVAEKMNGDRETLSGDIMKDIQVTDKLKNQMICTLQPEGSFKALNFQNLEKMAEVSMFLATKIESALFVEMKEEISKEYGKKFRDLNAALKNDEFTELREGLVTGKITSGDFVKYERDQLIPKSLILQREQSQKKYFQENVVIGTGEPIQVVMKSHKGEETREIFNPVKGLDVNDLSQETGSALEVMKQIHQQKKMSENENIEDLRQKWSTQNLHERFSERIDNYVVANPDTKTQLQNHLQKLNLKYQQNE